MSSYDQEFHLAQKAALEAGKAIAKYYGKAIKVSHKSHNQPLTKADLSANKIIKDILRKNFPDDGWLSEEDLDNEKRFQKSRLWIVDPLDGTKDFINQNPEFAVSIGLVENHLPVLGVVYNPITKELFAAVKNQGATCNGKKISVKEIIPDKKTHLLVSMSEHKRGEWTEYESQFKITPTGGCAYKMSKIAKGDADGTFTLSPKSEWDICAGTIIINEAGGIVSYLTGEPVQFNQPNTLMDGLIYCNNKDVHQEILKAIDGK